jgi:putative membrane protein
MARFMTEAGEAAFRDAIHAIEQRSSVEVVIAVRPRLRRWGIPHGIGGAATSAAVLAFILFSEDYEFDLWAIAVGPLPARLSGVLAVEAIAPLERALVPRSVRDAIAGEAARATFYELGVHGTRGRTGMLVFIAVRERYVTLIGDVAVVERIGQGGLARQAAALRGEFATAEAMAGALAKLAPDYATALPHATDDVNELGDLVQVAPRRWFRESAR